MFCISVAAKWGQVCMRATQDYNFYVSLSGLFLYYLANRDLSEITFCVPACRWKKIHLILKKTFPETNSTICARIILMMY